MCTTLADANENRDWRIYADFARVLIHIARGMYKVDEFRIELYNAVYTLDSTLGDIFVKKNTTDLPFRTEPECWFMQEQIVGEGVRKMLQQTLENEVQEYLEAHRDLKEEWKRVVVKNASLIPVLYLN